MRMTWQKVTLLIVSAGIAAYLSLLLYYSRQKRKHTGKEQGMASWFPAVITVSLSMID
jgi:hypothetical protein